MKVQIPFSKNKQKSFTLFTSIYDGKKFVAPAWIEVPADTQFSDIEIVMDLPKPVETKRSLHDVKGSTGTIYQVVIDTQNGNSCSCVGFNFHRNCKHIKQVLSQSK